MRGWTLRMYGPRALFWRRSQTYIVWRCALRNNIEYRFHINNFLGEPFSWMQGIFGWLNLTFISGWLVYSNTSIRKCPRAGIGVRSIIPILYFG
jgi:hypothetical protein